jgi:hypothetical protein
MGFAGRDGVDQRQAPLALPGEETNKRHPVSDLHSLDENAIKCSTCSVKQDRPEHSREQSHRQTLRRHQRMEQEDIHKDGPQQDQLQGNKAVCQ